MRSRKRHLGTVAVGAVIALAAAALAGTAGASGPSRGEIGPALRLTANGRYLRPAGRLTQVGDFPTGGALTKDGRFYWAVDSGHGRDDVRIVAVGDGHPVQTLPLPGAYGGIAFAP